MKIYLMNYISRKGDATMMKLAEHDSESLENYLKNFNSEEDLLELYSLHHEEIDKIYNAAMERKKKQPVPPDLIIRCKDFENVNLKISFHIYRTLLRPEAINGAGF